MITELAHHWVWMSAMEFACDRLYRRAYCDLPRVYKENWEDEHRFRLEHVLNNWDEFVA